MTSDRTPFLRMVVLGALSLSIGWGIRGNFGHAYGAMIPGALAAIAVVLASGREDWWRRIAYFAMFGALGWAFGGTISYMHVIAYTHSGHLPSQVYGFACLFVIGFVWGALGGAGTALPACLDRERLTNFFYPLGAVFAAWLLEIFLVPVIARMESAEARHESILYWYDTSWMSALLAILAVLVLAALRRRICWGTSLILHLAVGWWVVFLFMVFMVDGLGIEFRMTPPRGDNWAGVVGMTGGALVYFYRAGLVPVAHATLVAGCFGGFGFATATFLELVEYKYVPIALSYLFGEGAWQTNWHSALEQTYGLFNGVGIAVAMAILARHVPTTSDDPRTRRWTEAAAVAFVVLFITYVNFVKDVSTWIQFKAIPAALYNVPSRVWFNAGYALLSIAILALLARHLRSRLAMIPESWLGKGQLLYLVFLWWMVIANVMRAIPPFQDQRLITEGVIHVNAVLCTLLILVWPRSLRLPNPEAGAWKPRSLLGLLGISLLALTATVAAESAAVYLIFGSEHIKHHPYRTRFGPDAKTGKPVKGQPHP